MSHAGSVPELSGQLFGEVQNNSGVAQMGATVLLYNRYDQLVRQSLTNGAGKFVFDALSPDTYSIRVMLASFLPAVRRNIAVAPGSESLLKINLANVLSTVELVPVSASQGSLMTDDWKWVLRSSQATRPVLRFAPAPSSSKPLSTLASFSETSGVLRLSGGDGDSAVGSVAPDLGTAFGLATLVNGSARVRLSGNIGYMANSGLPSAGFRATYSRDSAQGATPQVALTAHQIYFPGLGPAGDPSGGTGQAGPAMRTANLSFLDKLDILDNLQLEYGGHIESVAFEQKVTYLSPFARATYDMGRKGIVKVGFSSGTEPKELMAQSKFSTDGQVNDQSALTQDLAALSMLPRISHQNGQMRLQRNETWEAGYQIVDGSRKYSLGAFVEDVRDAAYLVSGPVGALPPGDLLPDYGSSNLVLNVGGFWRSGYSAAVTQNVGENSELTLAGGRSGALVGPPDGSGQMRQSQRLWLTARLSTTVPETGTRVSLNYGWTDFRALVPIHFSLTDTINQEEGLNLVIRQPLPRVNCMPGRIEATIEVRNALGQGYLPIADSPEGRTVLMTSPRSLRGGLSFLF
jgi:hypothetical protein